MSATKPPPELICDVCGTRTALGVASMPGVPASFAYCRECLNANAHPYGIVVANSAMIGGLEHAAQWWKDLVEATLTHLGVPHEQFAADVRATEAEERAYFARLEAEEAASGPRSVPEDDGEPF